MGIAPLLADDFATSHLPKQVRPAASRVLLLARDAEAGAHDSALILTALANAHTPQGRFRQTAVVVRKFEMGFGLPGFLVDAQAQVVIHTIRADQLAWIHFPIGVPKRLEFLKRFDKFRAEHLRQQLRTGLAVSVLSRERAAARNHQVSGIIHELTELLDAFSGFQVEGDSIVRAAVTEVAVHDTAVAVGIRQDRKSTRLNSSHLGISYAVFCLKKKTTP